MHAMHIRHERSAHLSVHGQDVVYQVCHRRDKEVRREEHSSATEIALAHMSSGLAEIKLTHYTQDVYAPSDVCLSPGLLLHS